MNNSQGIGVMKNSRTAGDEELPGQGRDEELPRLPPGGLWRKFNESEPDSRAQFERLSAYMAKREKFKRFFRWPITIAGVCGAGATAAALAAFPDLLIGYSIGVAFCFCVVGVIWFNLAD